MTAQPLAVTAHLAGPIALPGGPLALDSLLAAQVAIRDGIPPALTPEAIVPIEIPIEREPGARFHLASFSVSEVERYEGRHLNRRFPVEEAQALGRGRVRNYRVSAGAGKSYRIPMETQHLESDMVRWWCIGEIQPIRELLAMVGHLGKKRSTGLGRVERWVVEPCETWEGFPVLLDGRPLRPLPPDWPGLGLDVMTEVRTLTYPYWDGRGRQLVAVPG